MGQLAPSKWDDHSWDTPAKLGQPGRVGRPMQGWDDPVKWDSLPQGGMARSWDTPAKLGQPSQTGTTQPNWDSPTAWDVPHRVGRSNRLGCPMQMWDDSVVDHPTTSLGHTTQAGTSHTNWADPIFSRLLSWHDGWAKGLGRQIWRTGRGLALGVSFVVSGTGRECRL